MQEHNAFCQEDISYAILQTRASPRRVIGNAVPPFPSNLRLMVAQVEHIPKNDAKRSARMGHAPLRACTKDTKFDGNCQRKILGATRLSAIKQELQVVGRLMLGVKLIGAVKVRGKSR